MLVFFLLFPSIVISVVTWGPWSNWSESCPRLCSHVHGVQIRQRLCLICDENEKCFPTSQPSVSRFCEGLSKQSRECYIASQCQDKGPFTGEWTGWQNIGFCRTDPPGECGKLGVQFQNRECRPTAATDKTATYTCPAKDMLNSFRRNPCAKECPAGQNRRKREAPVPIGQWSPWTQWICNDDCSSSTAMAVRSRRCSGQSFGYTCQPSSDGIKEYEVHPCRTTYGYLCVKTWSNWSSWSACHPKCGARKKSRTRDCMGHGGPCPGDSEENVWCLGKGDCDNVDGQWSAWSPWSQICSTTCGHGVYSRHRTCDNPQPSGSGKICAGQNVDTKPCETVGHCAVDGNWGTWSPWSCSITCGTGPGTRYRKCDNPPPHLSGKQCEGIDQETKDDACNASPCPQHGNASALPEHLLLRVKDDLRKMYNNYDKLEHQSVALVCGSRVADEIKETYPRTSTFWVKNGQPFKLDASRMTYENGDLLIQSVTAADIGVYLCQLEWQPHVRQTVGVYALVVQSNYKLHTRRHRNFQLHCNGASLGLLYGGLQQIWFHNGEIYKDYGITPPQAVNVEYFKDVGPEFSGLWECTINDPSSIRIWITNRVNVTVGGELGLIEKFLSNKVYLFGFFGILFCAVIATVVCCLYQDRKGEETAGEEVVAFKEIMKKITGNKKTSAADKPSDYSANEDLSTESSSIDSDEGLHLRDGGTVHTNVLPPI